MNNNKSILQRVYEAIEQGDTPKVPRVPKSATKRRRKKQSFVGPKRKAVKLLFCPRIHTLVKWWCKTSHQYMATFIQNDITDAFVKEISAHEDKIELMDKYYRDYFEDREERAQSDKEDEVEEPEEQT